MVLDGVDVTRLNPDARARRGLGWVPDDRGIYASLSVEENLLLPPVTRPESAWSLEQVYAEFPVLRERADFPGTRLSGGEQQMLALARVLRRGARLLLLDEPSEGLAPVIVQRIGEIIRDDQGAGRLGAAGRAERAPSRPPSPTATTCWPRAGSSSRSTTTSSAPAARSCSTTSGCDHRDPSTSTLHTDHVHRTTAPWETA